MADELRKQKVVIVGLGLMGGSLALGLRGRCAALWGVDADAQACALAVEMQAVERVVCTTDQVGAGELIAEASFIILATPVRAILDWIERLAVLHSEKAIVLDLGSTKLEIGEALERLPERFSAVGGHPMCGKEQGSIRFADPEIYRDAPFVLTRLKNSSKEAVELSEELARLVGARPVWLEADLHDRWVAVTSHLPYLLANALADVVPGEAAAVIGPGFRSTARLAGSPARMMLDVLLTNRTNILASLADLQMELEELRQALVRGDERALLELLRDGGEKYAEILARAAVEGQLDTSA